MSSTQEVGEIFGEGRGPAHAMLRSPTVLIASVGLWGMNVFFYRLFGINYIKVLRRDLIEIEANESQEDGWENSSQRRGKSIEMADLSDNSEDDLDDPSSANDEASCTGNGHTSSTAASLPPVDRSGAITWERLVTMSVVLLFLLHFTYV